MVRQVRIDITVPLQLANHEWGVRYGASSVKFENVLMIQSPPDVDLLLEHLHASSSDIVKDEDRRMNAFYFRVKSFL